MSELSPKKSFMPQGCDHVRPDLIHDFDMFHVPPSVTDPTEIWHQLKRRGVPDIFFTPRNGGHWVFLNYDDIVTAYRQHDIFSSRNSSMPPMEDWPTLQPVGLDPPQNDIFRRVLAPSFTPRAVREFTEELTRRAVPMIERIAQQGSCDFIEEYACRFPTSAFLYIFGLPEERLPDFLKIAHKFFRTNDPDLKREAVQQIMYEIDFYFKKKLETPQNDLATAIVNACDEDGVAYPWQDRVNCGFLMFAAGLDTVTNTMSYVWHHLATASESRQFFRSRLDDPDAFLLALEELMRINAVSNIMRRVKTDTVYKGIVMRENDRVVLPNTVANRDPAKFDNPQTVDLTRQVNQHVTFGAGPHRCVGSHLAKREIFVSMREWLKRIPDFQLADQDLGSAFGGSVMGFTSLKLRW